MAAKYVVGIDVGANSTGFAAVEVDETGFPVQILNALSFIHDSGVDPFAQKQGNTRQAVSGVARRTRRLIRRRRQRLKKLDSLLRDLGYPVADNAKDGDPLAPWLFRSDLVEEFVDDEAERRKLLSVAIRHIARHRGWRNPYSRIETLLQVSEQSGFMVEFRKRVQEAVGNHIYLEDDLTVGQLVARLVDVDAHHPLRRALSDDQKTANQRATKEGYPAPHPEPIIGKLEQKDNASELLAIGKMQHVEADELEKIIRAVFEQESPRGSWAGRVGKDPLNGKPRAPKSHLAFQKYRIASLIANLRILDGEKRVLTVDERNRIFNFLWEYSLKNDPTWDEVAEVLGVSRGALKGTNEPTEDGEVSSTRPPINVTDSRIRSSSVKEVVRFWDMSDDIVRNSLVLALTNEEAEGEDSPADEFFQSLTDEDFLKLENIKLPAGRAAYSVQTLDRLSERLLESEHDLFQARLEILKEKKANELGISPNDLTEDQVGELRGWKPPAEPIGAPVGNPAVDRVTKQVSRWLLAAEREWGAPQRVTIEHVRSGLVSELVSRELERENNRRFQQNKKVFDQMAEAIGVKTSSRDDLRRYQAIQRQNCQCLYCGDPITFVTAEMDHIIPRAGVGSSNRRDNLAAVCHRCNLSKGKQVFARWAQECGIPGVSINDAVERVGYWISDPSIGSSREQRDFKRGVVARLKRTEEDPELDERSLESVAWMANELHHRIERHFGDSETKVAVYRGELTAEARKASGIENRIAFIGASGKTRLDRRHHAVDATVIAMMNPSVAVTLAERSALRLEEGIEGRRDDEGNWVKSTWKHFAGSTNAAVEKFNSWREQMERLLILVNEGLATDEIPVTRQLRLRLGNSKAHDDSVRELKRVTLGSALPVDLIDRASTPALWCALTRHPDYSPSEGLPEDPNRQIRLHDKRLSATDEISFFADAAASILVRGGSSQIGDSVHHARIYRIETTLKSGKKKTSYGMLRVFLVDLLSHSNENLFTVDLPPQCVSRRYAYAPVRKALDDGSATYLGWIVVGDELLLDMSSQSSGAVSEFLHAERLGQSLNKVTGEVKEAVVSVPLAQTRRWVVAGFYGPLRLRLRPSQLSYEGVSSLEEVPSAVKSILDAPGWLPTANVVWSKCQPTVIRRSVLGHERFENHAHLPASWKEGSKGEV